MPLKKLEPNDKIRTLINLKVLQKRTARGVRYNIRLPADSIGVVIRTNPLICKFRLLIDPGDDEFSVEHDIAFNHPDGQIAPLR